MHHDEDSRAAVVSQMQVALGWASSAAVGKQWLGRSGGGKLGRWQPFGMGVQTFIGQISVPGSGCWEEGLVTSSLSHSLLPEWEPGLTGGVARGSCP